MFKNINSSKQIRIIYVFLIIVTIAVFAQVTQMGFINYDDDVYVTGNSHLQSGITMKGICWAFGKPYAEFWHPLTLLSLMMDYQLYGMNPLGYHLTNLILHILSTLLLFWLFNRMTGAVWRSALVAAVFALHPLHVESVAWISERKDVLSAFFWILTLCLYVYYTEKPFLRRYLLVLFCFVCGLMSKPMLVTLPVVMILLDYWPLKRFILNRDNVILWQLREKTPFFIFSAIFSIITIRAQSIMHVEYPLTLRIANAPVSFITYLEKIFWPSDLAFVYPFPNQIPAWQVAGSTVLIIAVSIAVILSRKKLPYLFVGWFWYAITILPVIGIVSVGDPMADRYIYLPSIGVVIIMAWSIPVLIKSAVRRKIILFPAGVAVLAILSVLTWKQCVYWKNSVDLFNHTLRVTKNNFLAYNNLGLALTDEGKVNEAIDNYNKGIRIMPHVMIFNNRGRAFGELGQYKLALEDFNKALRLDPNYYIAYFNKGIVYGKLSQYKPAIEEFNKSILINPDYAEAYHRRGVAYLLQDDKTNGCRDAQKACDLGHCQLFEFVVSRGYCR
jgi:protein O-mannosyl-transferase